MLFPFIASKANKNILFEQSRFSHETEQDVKGSTARVVLGNMLKDTGGYVYTYEVSFYGNYKEVTSPLFRITLRFRFRKNITKNWERLLWFLSIAHTSKCTRRRKVSRKAII